MSTDTQNGQAEHDASEHEPMTPIPDALMPDLGAVAMAVKVERARHTARIDQLTAERARINATIAVERAEVERCDSLLAWATKTVKPRGKPKTVQPAPNKRR